jgi:hypothetical protein
VDTKRFGCGSPSRWYRRSTQDRRQVDGRLGNLIEPLFRGSLIVFPTQRQILWLDGENQFECTQSLERQAKFRAALTTLEFRDPESTGSYLLP